MMKNALFLSTIVILSVFGFNVFPTLAQPTSSAHSQNKQSVSLPQSTSIVVAFPREMQFKVDDDEVQPATLVLAQPILDNVGNVIVPADSIVQASIVPADDEDTVQIQATAIVTPSLTISVQAYSSDIPTQRIRRPDADDRQAREDASIERGIANAGLIETGLTIDDSGNNLQAAMAAGMQRAARTRQLSQFGRAIGSLFRSNNMDVASIPRGSVWVLTLQAPVTVSIPVGTASAPVPSQLASPSSGTNQNPAIVQSSGPTRDSSTVTEFKFRNVRQYSETVEQILASQQQGQLSLEEAQAMVASADRFATTQLTPQLYPLAGVRQRVTEMLGFTYALDR
jgi:hypothetical protein